MSGPASGALGTLPADDVNVARSPAGAWSARPATGRDRCWACSRRASASGCRPGVAGIRGSAAATVPPVAATALQVWSHAASPGVRCPGAAGPANPYWVLSAEPPESRATGLGEQLPTNSGGAMGGDDTIENRIRRAQARARSAQARLVRIAALQARLDALRLATYETQGSRTEREPDESPQPRSDQLT